MDTKDIDKTHAILKYNLSRLLPIRVVLRENEGKIEGLVENSFSMSWSDKVVNIFWSGKAYSMLGEHSLDAVADAQHNAKSDGKVIDPLADDSPIEVDWEAWTKATTKFNQRNAPFKLKEQK